jgi:hypothetical protein
VPPVQLSSQAEIPIGKVDQDGGVRPAAIHIPQQLTKFGVDLRNVRDYFRQPNHRDVPRLHHQVASGEAHALAADTGTLKRRIMPAQCFHEQGAVGIARSFAGGNEESHGSTGSTR